MLVAKSFPLPSIFSKVLNVRVLYGMTSLFTKQQNFRLIEIVDNKINMTQKLYFFLLEKENIVGNGENTL